MSARSLVAPAVITCIVLVATAALAEFVWKPGTPREKPADPVADVTWDAAPRKKPRTEPPRKQKTAFSPTVRVRGKAVHGGSGLVARAKFRLVWVLDPLRPKAGPWTEFNGNFDTRIEALRPYRVELAAEFQNQEYTWSSNEPSWEDEFFVPDFIVGDDDRRPVRFVHHDDTVAEDVILTGPDGHTHRALVTAEGHFLRPGRYVAALEVGMGNARHVVATKFDAGLDPQVVRLPPPRSANGSLQVEILDRHNCAMPTTHVRCLRYEAETGVLTPMDKDLHESSDTEPAMFQDLIAGTYFIEGISGNTELSRTVAVIEADDPHARVTMRLPGPALIRLTVTHHGAPAAGLTVSVHRDVLVLDQQGKGSLLLERPISYSPSLTLHFEGHKLSTRLGDIREGQDHDAHVRLEDVIDPPKSGRLQIEFLPSASVPNPRDLDPYVYWSGTMGRWEGNTYTVHGLYLPMSNGYVYCRNVPGYRVKVPITITSPGTYRTRVKLAGARIQANMDRATNDDPRGVRWRGFRWICLDDARPSWCRVDDVDFMYSTYLAPGDYLVAAVVGGETTAWQRIRIEDGKDLHIAWKLIESPNELQVALEKALAEK